MVGCSLVSGYGQTVAAAPSKYSSRLFRVKCAPIFLVSQFEEDGRRAPRLHCLEELCCKGP